MEKELQYTSGTVLYQICIKGQYKNFANTTKICSKNVFVNKPTKEEISVFIEKCCNNKTIEISYYDLDEKTIEISILELILIC